MTFEESAYKERVMFAKLNRLRDEVFGNESASNIRELRRQDFAQQKKTLDPIVRFQGEKVLRIKGGLKGQILASAGAGMKEMDVSLAHGRMIQGDMNKGKSTSKERTVIQKRTNGGKNVLQEGHIWTTEGYQERAKPSVLEQQNLIPPDASKPKPLPSLRERAKSNGRYPRQLQNPNPSVSKRAGPG